MYPVSKLKVVTFAACISVVPGCANMSPGQQQAAGAAFGGVLAGGLCALAGGKAGTCAAIGAAGLAVGWGAVALSQYHEAQVRSANQVQQIYGLREGVSSPIVKIQQGMTPSRVKRGQALTLTTDYDLMLPKSTPSVEVEEVWTLKKDGKVLAPLPPVRKLRTQGGYTTGGSYPIPSNAAPGVYSVEHRVTCGPSYDVRESIFVIEA